MTHHIDLSNIVKTRQSLDDLEELEQVRAYRDWRHEHWEGSLDAVKGILFAVIGMFGFWAGILVWGVW